MRNCSMSLGLVSAEQQHLGKCSAPYIGGSMKFWGGNKVAQSFVPNRAFEG